MTGAALRDAVVAGFLAAGRTAVAAADRLPGAARLATAVRDDATGRDGADFGRLTFAVLRFAVGVAIFRGEAGRFCFRAVFGAGFRRLAADFLAAVTDLREVFARAVFFAADRRAGRTVAVLRLRAARTARAERVEAVVTLGRLRFRAACFERERLVRARGVTFLPAMTLSLPPG